MHSVSFLTWNVSNPSIDRARRQLAWLATRSEPLLVLTETKASAGCALLQESFEAAGYEVANSDPQPGELGTMIVSRISMQKENWPARLEVLPSRACAVRIHTSEGEIVVLGLYVPSRDASPEKTARKRMWLESCRSALESGLNPADGVILLGDFNVLEPEHYPKYRFFAPFEYGFYEALSAEFNLVDAFRYLHPGDHQYSWVGRTGDGYRYDHAFCSRRFGRLIRSCRYVHEPRHARLSDHSALSLSLDLAVPDDHELAVTPPLDVSAPPSLF